mgnify:CR=1 FL=1
MDRPPQINPPPPVEQNAEVRIDELSARRLEAHAGMPKARAETVENDAAAGEISFASLDVENVSWARWW